MPGTTFAVQNATCPVSAKKLSGLRLITRRPTGRSGTSSSGTIFVAASGPDARRWQTARPAVPATG
jgi:hypothetical protein